MVGGMGGSSLRLKLLNQSHCTQTPSALGQMVRAHAALKLKSVTVTLSPRSAPHQVRMLLWDPPPPPLTPRLFAKHSMSAKWKHQIPFQQSPPIFVLAEGCAIFAHALRESLKS